MCSLKDPLQITFKDREGKSGKERLKMERRRFYLEK